MIMRKLYYICIGFLSLVLISCSDTKKPPIDLSNVNKKGDVSVSFTEIRGIKTIPIKINGVSIDAIYDPGCSDVQLSLHELQTLDKNGKFHIEDILGFSIAQIADGSKVIDGDIFLREITIGEGDNPIVLKNVKGSFALNDEAPVLLGNGVLNKVASVEVDNINKKIVFKRNK